jgi:hypothetical protein
LNPQYPNVAQGNQNNVVYGQPVYGQPVYNQPQPVYVNANGQVQPQFQNQPYPPTYVNTTQVVVPIPTRIVGGGIQTAIVFQYCAVCKKNTTTQVNYRSAGLVWIMALVFCLFTGCLCFIPFFIDQWKDKDHVCTQCQNVKGVVKGDLC